MYAFIRGTLIQANPLYAVLEARGIGFKIQIPSSTFSHLQEVGQEIQLFTSFVVREQFQGLYGFLQEEERDLFETLIEISGIGPKTALSLIGNLPLEQLHDVILTDNAAALSKVPGIGKKTAERLLVELRNKLETFFKRTPSHYALTTPADPKNQKMQDGIKALVTLGYTYTASQKAIKKALQGSEDIELGSLITHALKHV